MTNDNEVDLRDLVAEKVVEDENKVRALEKRESILQKEVLALKEQLGEQEIVADAITTTIKAIRKHGYEGTILTDEYGNLAGIRTDGQHSAFLVEIPIDDVMSAIRKLLEDNQ